MATKTPASDEVTNTYVAVTDTLESEELDLSAAIEIPGHGDAWVHEGAVYVADGESPKVTRYSLGERGQLEPGDTLDFSAYGVLGAAFYDNDIVSPTKAYLANVGNREYVAWNPTTMEITGTVPWPEMDFGELMPFHSYMDRGGAVVDGLYFHGIYGHDEDFFSFGEHSFINVWELYSIDLETLEVEPTGILFSDGSYYESKVGDAYYVYLGAGSNTQLYRRTAAGEYGKKLKVVGWMSRLFELR